MKNFLKILITTVLIIFAVILFKTLQTANKIDREIRLEKQIKLEKEEIEKIFLIIGDEIKSRISNENSSMGEKIKILEECDEIILQKIKNSNLSPELKKEFISQAPIFIKAFKNTGYAAIYTAESLRTLDLSYIDLAENKFEELNYGKLKEQSKKYFNSMRKAIIELKYNNLSKETLNEVVKNEEELLQEFNNLSAGILD